MANPAFDVSKSTVTIILQDGGQLIVYSQNTSRTKREMKNRYRSFTKVIQYETSLNESFTRALAM
jgi:ribosomal protein L30E